MIKYRSDWPKPRIKHPRQVLVRPTVAGICASDMGSSDKPEGELSYDGCEEGGEDGKI